MILVCDSGSTKADWILCRDKMKFAEFSTMGFNPFFHNAETVYKELSKDKGLKKFETEIREVFFFGAGCSSPARNSIIRKGLQKFFPKAKVLVEHDMLGAAIAACGNQSGIVCILGTGSNTCYYNGKELLPVVHG